MTTAPVQAQAPTRRYIVRGLVQGVGFRWFVQDHARSLNLRGWVRNLTDGSVEVTAQGPAESLDRLAGHLFAGPKDSRVVGVEEYAGVVPGPGPFEIR